MSFCIIYISDYRCYIIDKKKYTIILKISSNKTNIFRYFQSKVEEKYKMKLGLQGFDFISYDRH